MRKSFTLLELLVTIGIIVLLTGVGVNRFRYTDRQQVLDNSAIDIKQTLAKARALALAIPSELADQGIVGWGVRFSHPAGKPVSMQIFYRKISSGGGNDDTDYLASLQFPPDITVSNVADGSSSSSSLPGPVIFLPASGGRVNTSSGPVQLWLEHSKIKQNNPSDPNLFSRKITVNTQTGLVEVFHGT